MTSAANALSIAAGQLGYHEGYSHGHWNNNNKFGAAVGMNGEPWCAYFVLWVMKHAGVDMGTYPTSGSCTANMNWAKKHNRWLPGGKNGKPGDIAIFNAHPGGTPVHTGIVERVEGGMVHTIDGNSNRSGSAEGNAVVRKSRPTNRVIGYIRPNYTPSPTPSKPPAFTETLHLGSVGKQVAALQKALKIPVTGKYDETLMTAVKKHQASRPNLHPADGVCGPLTYKSILGAGK